MKRIIGTLFLAATFGGCMTARERFLQEDFRTEEVAIPHKLGKVTIVDRRKNVADKDWSIPFIEIKFSNMSVSPPLTREHEDLIKAELPQYFLGTNTRMDARIEVLFGQKRYVTDWHGQHERALAKIRITLLDPASGDALAFGTGESDLHLDAPGGINSTSRLYAKALKVAVYQAMKGIANPS